MAEMIPKPTPTLMTETEANEIAEMNNRDEREHGLTEPWTYTVRPVGAHFAIFVFDEDGIELGPI